MRQKSANLCLVAWLVCYSTAPVTGDYRVTSSQQLTCFDEDPAAGFLNPLCGASNYSKIRYACGQHEIQYTKRRNVRLIICKILPKHFSKHHVQ
jgi:hypothetical protein